MEFKDKLIEFANEVFGKTYYYCNYDETTNKAVILLNIENIINYLWNNKTLEAELLIQDIIMEGKDLLFSNNDEVYHYESPYGYIQRVLNEIAMYYFKNEYLKQDKTF